MRTCLECKHFRVWAADPGYSEYTPGSDFSMVCEKDKWNFDAYEAYLEDFRKMLRTAETCDKLEVMDGN